MVARQRGTLIFTGPLDAFATRLKIATYGGIVLAMTISAISPLPATVAPWSVFIGVGLGMTVGIIAGVYPATRAAKLDPIVALRAE